MDKNIDIFKDGKEISYTWATFKDIGDSFQGTYIGKSKAIDSYSNPQTVYELLQKGGGVIRVGFRDTKTPIHDRMNNIRFGQIVGFKYTEDVPSKEKGRSPMKNIRIFADAKLVDEAWLKTQHDLPPRAPEAVTPPGFLEGVTAAKKADDDFNSLGAAPVDNDTAPFPTVGALTDEQKVVRIAELANLRFPKTDPSKVKDVVMEATNLAFIPVNLDAIIKKLKDMPAF